MTTPNTDDVVTKTDAPVRPTEGPWQTKHDYSLEGLATIIANVDGEIIEGSNHYTYDTVAICADEFGEYLPNAASNARLIVAACNSYQQCKDPVASAEADLLGLCIEALRELQRNNRQNVTGAEARKTWDKVNAILATVREGERG